MMPSSSDDDFHPIFLNNRRRNPFSKIIRKYSRPVKRNDVIDLNTMTIVEDGGYLRHRKACPFPSIEFWQAIGGYESDEGSEPPKKKEKNIKRKADCMRRSRSLSGVKEDVEKRPKEKFAGETSTIDDSSVMNVDTSPSSPDQGYDKKKGRPKKKPFRSSRDSMGRFAKESVKQPQQPCPRIQTRKTDLQLLKAGLPLFFQS